MSASELVNLFVIIGTTRDGQGSARLPFVHALASGNVDIGVADRGHHTTVDEDIDSVDKTRRIREQKRHHRCDLVRAAFAAQGSLRNKEVVDRPRRPKATASR